MKKVNSFQIAKNLASGFFLVLAEFFENFRLVFLVKLLLIKKVYNNFMLTLPALVYLFRCDRNWRAHFKLCRAKPDFCRYGLATMEHAPIQVSL